MSTTITSGLADFSVTGEQKYSELFILFTTGVKNHIYMVHVYNI